ncbi:MAG: type II toxin-antitoxin system RelE/ParE family toxin [Cyanobacteria bacterium J06639_16]
MSSDTTQYEIRFTDEFKDRVRSLAKRYRGIQADLEPLLQTLSFGNLIGDQIAGTGYTTFKVRLKNSNIKKGKSAGYRVIYQLRESAIILLVTIYSKSDQDSIPEGKIRSIIAKFDKK